MNVGDLQSPLLLETAPHADCQSSIRHDTAHPTTGPAEVRDVRGRNNHVTIGRPPVQSSQDQSCFTIGEDHHVHFASMSITPEIADRDVLLNASELEESTAKPPSSNDGRDRPRGRSLMRATSPSGRPRGPDIPEGNRHCRTSVQSCGRHALDRWPSDEGGFAETALELPQVDVPGSILQEANSWSLTDQFSSSSSNSSNTSLYLRPAAFPGHRDTFARIARSRMAAPDIPSLIWPEILQYLTHEDFLHLRLTSKVWHSAIPLPKFPISFSLPVEIIQETYSYLSPQDFNAARHTCKAWFAAALDRDLLAFMLRRGGWLAAAEADIDMLWYQRVPGHSRTVSCQFMDSNGDNDFAIVRNETWLMSKRLATECSLSKHWRGLSLRSGSIPECTSFCASIDFNGLLASAHQPNSTHFMPFTISACGRFVLVSKDNVIYVYRLSDEKETLQAVTSIMCPHNVIAVSMDTSTQRYAVAALLEGRVGLVCDIHNTVARSLGSSPVKARRRISFSNVFGTDSDFDVRVTRQRSTMRRGSGLFKRRSRSRSLGPRPPLGEGETCVTKSAYVPPGDNIFPVESGQRSIYRNLCTIDDPPRSVAICPQRRCVAFGCRLGIELHWVDALSGQDLNRWFPLASPSDYLYFLPPKKGIDSTKKLRLVSSAAGPDTDALDDQSGTNRNWRVYGPRSHSMTRLFFGNIPYATGSGRNDVDVRSSQARGYSTLRAVDCDHFRAVPLSDGVHMLFIDPETDHLCLGSDAPIGGPTKLLRKVVFVPPRTPDCSQSNMKNESEALTAAISQSEPLAYTAGNDLRWGVRVVSAYASGQIVLFSVPPDLFERLQDTAALMTGLPLGSSDLALDTFVEHTENSISAAVDGFESPEAESPASSFTARCARVDGVEVGKMENVVDISVDCSHGGLRIWAFSANGQGSVWKLCTERPEDRTVLRTVIGSDGIVKDLGEFDWEGDVVMVDRVNWPTNQRRFSSPSETPSQPGSPTKLDVARSPASPADQDESTGSKKGKHPQHISFLDGTSTGPSTSPPAAESRSAIVRNARLASREMRRTLDLLLFCDHRHGVELAEQAKKKKTQRMSRQWTL